MHYVNLFDSRLFSCGWIEELYETGLNAVLGTRLGHIEQNGTISLLNSVSEEDRHVDVLIFVEPADLLTHHLEIVGIELCAHLIKLFLGNLHEVFCE